MRSRALLMLLIALLAGLAATVMAARWMQRQGSAGTPVLVARQDIPIGSALTPEMLQSVDWPRGQRPEGSFEQIEALKGRVVTAALMRGEPVLAARLAAPGTPGGLVALVAPGKRAMTVRVNDVVGVAGFALPGTLVDVLVNTQEDRGEGVRERPISKIVLERMLVLAVAQDVDRDPTRPKVVNAVTLEVAPREAEILDLARSVGTLSLVLRNPTEARGEASGGVTKDTLLGTVPRATPAPAPAPMSEPTPRPVRVAEPRPAPAAPAPMRERSCVDIIRGSSKVTECF
ncbi:MAG: hypothetical protein RLZZ592_1896 [Pseudomonadota bacterium]|jgi:pilus assembly protein CpaB